MAELLGIISIITGLDHNGLSAGESAVEDNYDLTVLEAVINNQIRNN